MHVVSIVVSVFGTPSFNFGMQSPDQRKWLTETEMTLETIDIFAWLLSSLFSIRAPFLPQGAPK